MISGRNSTGASARDDEGTPRNHWQKALAYDTLLEMPDVFNLCSNITI